MGILDLPEDLKQRLRDSLVDFVANQVEKMPEGHNVSKIVRQISTQAAFYNAFDKAIPNALDRFRKEYLVQDEDLVEALTIDSNFWQSTGVRQALVIMVMSPGAWLVNEREIVTQHFVDILPKRVNRERVDKAINFFLGCVVEELWVLPGVKEIREIYSLQFQKMTAEAARQQVNLLDAQLQATTQLSIDIREALLQLAMSSSRQHLLEPPTRIAQPSPRPYHNLPQPDYTTRFVGRQKEQNKLLQHLSLHDRAWQIAISGIGGVGKSSLALAVAYHYSEHYNELLPDERFDAIIWITAKEDVLTIKGKGNSALPGLTFHTLDDMYTSIAQALEREDITRALPEARNRLVQKALRMQRTLLIVDNFESVIDEQVSTFLYNLPPPTKCVITSREWFDVAVVIKLTGLSPEEAENLISEEATAREVQLNATERELLFKRTAGLPLPIKLSIAQMASGQNFEQVMRWLGNAAGALPEYCVKGQVDMAYQRDPKAWRLLLACSLFDWESGASREVLGYIADLSLADRDDGLTSLQRLCLLNCTDDDRFWALSMVQGYASTQLIMADFSDLLTDRWLKWLLNFAQQFGVDLDLHVEKTEMVGKEYPNLLSAIRWCREHESWMTLLQLAEGTFFYAFLVGLFGELREILESSLQATKELNDEHSRIRFLRRIGELFEIQGQDEKALKQYLEAEEIAQRYNDDFEIGRIANERSTLLFKKGQVQEAETLARRTLKIGEKINNLELKVLGASQLSRYLAAKQQFVEALEWLDRAEEWAKDYGWTRGLAWLLYRRGTTLIQRGTVVSAEPFLMQSLHMALSWNDRGLVCHNKIRAAEFYLESGQLYLAHQMAFEADDLCEQLGMPMELAAVEELIRKLPRAN